ncbi:hypothetical protein [Leptolyngbya sp. FACHB-711]|uniref:hypothetical protein n=1 Tax=Leptolyngbya sp. FACHB-711 TaxID=2692813 RepID=UPI00168480E6|nr:hypothetical protein [Leptolyngbya sp. FACHB-711]MBD1851871.1 hypothetical protein [Cyanobacteria bacterium FACHB-502]MBD2025715.1 hypothetical protein [Leptolyngbya sp. FACHB-711]
MTVRVPERNNVAARWTQATAITFALYLIMSQSQSAFDAAPEWRSTSGQAGRVQLISEFPTLPFR